MSPTSPHAFDTHAETETAARAIAAAMDHFGLRPTDVARGSGSYSSTVRVLTLKGGQRCVLKLPHLRHKLYREIAALEALADSVPVPRLLDVWEPEDDAPGALLLSFVPGTTLLEEHPSPVQTSQMGALLARIHEHRLGRFGEVHPKNQYLATSRSTTVDWWILMVHRLKQWQADCEAVLPADLFSACIDLYRTFAENLPAPDGPCWTHHDYRPGNILTDGVTITGVIDFESARAGSADIDFTKVSHRLWPHYPGLREAFLAGYASVRPLPPIDQTLPFYQLHNAFGGIAWCVRRTNQDDPFFAENLATLRGLVAEYDRQG